MNDMYQPSQAIRDLLKTSVVRTPQELREFIVEYRNVPDHLKQYMVEFHRYGRRAKSIPVELMNDVASVYYKSQKALDNVFRGIYPMINNIVRKNIATIMHWELPYEDVFNLLVTLAKTKVIDTYDVSRKESLITMMYRWLQLTMYQLPRYMLTQFDAERGYGMKGKPDGFTKNSIMNIEHITSGNICDDDGEMDITSLIDPITTERNRVKSSIYAAIEDLTDKEKDLVNLIYGIDGSKPMKAKRALKELGMTADDKDEALSTLASSIMKYSNRSFNQHINIGDYCE